MPDVLLGQAYYLRFDPKLHQAQQPYAPLGTLYAATFLRQRGHRVALFDAMLARSVADWTTALQHHQPRLAAIYEDSFNYLSKMCLLRMREAAFEMIDRARAVRVPVVVSGSDATDHPELYLRRGAAAVILGEGELTLAELAERLLAGSTIDAVPGIAYLDDTCALHRTAPRPFIKSLDELPFPAWDLVDTNRYREIWHARHGYYSMNIATTRGCPYHCNWCAKPIYGQRYATRAAKAVVEEIAWLKHHFAPDHLWIVDDVFGLKPGWVEEFAALVNEQGAQIPFRCLMRADQVTPAVARALASAGCRMLWMGAESGSQKVLDAMEKGLRVDDIRAANRALQAHGINVGVFLQFGYPGETWEDIEATLQLARELKPADIGVSVSYPLPGTGFYERVRQELGVKQNWIDSSDLSTMYKATYAPAVYRRVHGLVHHEFRARKSADALSAMLRAPWQLRPVHARRAASWFYNRAALALMRRHVSQLRIESSC
ncbi:MAG TPA: radical SAM protein [Vicinamibacterales bacterium]|nr:radical SAM protein [Vicinamibacterales bacterium]